MQMVQRKGVQPQTASTQSIRCSGQALSVGLSRKPQDVPVPIFIHAERQHLHKKL